MTDKLRVVVLCCDGLYQRYLLQRTAETHQLAGIVLHATPDARGGLASRLWRYRNLLSLLRHLQARLLMRGYQRQAEPLVRQLFFKNGQAPAIPVGTPLIRVGNVNDPMAVTFVRQQAPDIVLVNGTNLLRQPLLDLIPTIPLGIINLHTGLSPYSRGGNCNLYMLLEGHPEQVGITVHHIDPGIDSGDIIISARPELAVSDNYEMIDAKTFRLGIDRLLTAVHQLREGRAVRVRQWEEGRLFLRRTGYVYQPWQRVEVNRLLRQGLIDRYLANRQRIDASVRLVGKPD